MGGGGGGGGGVGKEKINKPFLICVHAKMHVLYKANKQSIVGKVYEH